MVERKGVSVCAYKNIIKQFLSFSKRYVEILKSLGFYDKINLSHNKISFNPSNFINSIKKLEMKFIHENMLKRKLNNLEQENTRENHF